ncbi:MAG TPA: hypothetical protein VE978_00860 [Chitinophagales bacterium]|nr:hypothetical protein [Chitinophagales bacterium]
MIKSVLKIPSWLQPLNLKTPRYILCISSTILLVFTFQRSFSQSVRFKAKVSIATIVTKNNQTVKGILYAVNDSMVALYTENTAAQKDFLLRDSLPLTIYSYRDIQIIKVRKRSAPEECALIGGGTGLLFGLLIDAIINVTKNIYNEIPFVGSGEEVPLTPVFTIAFGLLGTGAGAAFGSLPRKFEINGNKINFNERKYALTKYCLKKNF